MSNHFVILLPRRASQSDLRIRRKAEIKKAKAVPAATAKRK